MVNLIGVYEANADDKGRVMLPSAFKKQLAPVLADGFIIKRSVFQKCLELYPLSEWNKVMGEVNKLNRFVKKNADFIRVFSSGTKPLELDSAGRFLVPKDLQGFAGISKNIVMAAAVNMIELWDKDKYEQVVNEGSVDFASLAEEVMGGAQNQQGT